MDLPPLNSLDRAADLDNGHDSTRPILVDRRPGTAAIPH